MGTTGDGTGINTGAMAVGVEIEVLGTVAVATVALKEVSVETVPLTEVAAAVLTETDVDTDEALSVPPVTRKMTQTNSM